MSWPEGGVIGWDVGGAHVKACLLQRAPGGFELSDVAQWPCPLWQGLEHLDRVLLAARERWPQAARTEHAVTMTGEMVDLFAHREAGVGAIADRLAAGLGAPLHFFVAGDDGPQWCGADRVSAHWPRIASANWLATAWVAAQGAGDALLVDIGSTTTDLVALRRSRVETEARSDAERLASGELVYHGVVRTPLCALGASVPFRGVATNVMNEFFATTADVYRLTGELDAAHDQHPSADGYAKDVGATRQRLARMVGRDARDLAADDVFALAEAWRDAQLAELRRNALRVIERCGLPADAPLVAAGCGGFLVRRLAAELGRRSIGFVDLALGGAVDATLAGWVQVAAPSVAVALLWARRSTAQVLASDAGTTASGNVSAGEGVAD